MDVNKGIPRRKGRKPSGLTSLLWITAAVLLFYIWQSGSHATGSGTIQQQRASVVRVLAVSSDGTLSIGSGWAAGSTAGTESPNRRDSTNNPNGTNGTDSINSIDSTNSTGFLPAYGTSSIVTSEHVVRGAAEVYVQYVDEIIPVVKITSDEGIDAAVLELESPQPRLLPLKLRTGKHAEPAESVWSLGFPAVSDEVLGRMRSTPEEVTVTDGIISKSTADAQGRGMYQTTAAMNGGSSGGPLLDEKGRVIGINTFMALDGSQGIFGAVRSDELLPLLEKAGVRYEIASRQLLSPLWIDRLLSAAGGAALFGLWAWLRMFRRMRKAGLQLLDAHHR
ncbi:trypsin-like peptidase domain-containing protein [Paenibacillus gansuensis]|uniref:Trypsin-like peptidase domain-containing protein n=1 Tax=Paenibacillus gansuensis TaxID=306542 RepID=A0ABW5PGG9_9BACL